MTHRQRDEPTAPTSFPNTQPPTSNTDMSPWLLTAINDMKSAIGRVEATSIAIQTHLTLIESDLNDVKKEVEGHGRWMHTLKVLLAVLGTFIGIVTTVVIAPMNVPSTEEAPSACASTGRAPQPLS